MKIPFTRDGKLDDTYDTKDGILYLYGEYTSNTSGLRLVNFWTDSSRTKKSDINNPISNKDALRYILLGKCKVIAISSTSENECMYVADITAVHTNNAILSDGIKKEIKIQTITEMNMQSGGSLIQGIISVYVYDV